MTAVIDKDAAENETQRVDYSYDALDRLSGIDAPGTVDDIGYAYDTCPNGVGRLCTVTYGGGAFPAGKKGDVQSFEEVGVYLPNEKCFSGKSLLPFAGRHDDQFPVQGKAVLSYDPNNAVSHRPDADDTRSHCHEFLQRGAII